MDTSRLNQNYNPEKVIVVYRNISDYYLEVHNVNNKGLSPGVPLSKKGMTKLVRAVHDTQSTTLSFKGIIPDNLIYYNCNPLNPKIIWFSPGGRKTLYWTKGMDLPDGFSFVPPMIFKCSLEDLEVYALKDSIPTNDSMLYNVPLCNISQGHVCIGNAKLKEFDYIEDIMNQFEDVFWKTKFSGHNLQNSEIISGYNFYHFWKNMINEQLEFPLDVLVPTDKKLKNIL